MKSLRKEEILNYFEEINQHLAEQGKYGEIMVVGGAALTIVFNARYSTQDVDAIFHPKEDLRKIIGNMAKKYALEQDWLNDTVKPFVTKKIEFETFLEYSNLTVSNANAESLLAMKLTSARFGTSDMDDSIFLVNRPTVKTGGL